MGFVTTVMACDYLSGATGSLATAYGAHTGIGTLPVVLYGTEAQNKNIFRIWQRVITLVLTALLSQMLVQMLTQGKLKQNFLKMVSITSSTGRKCGFLTRDLLRPSHYLQNRR